MKDSGQRFYEISGSDLSKTVAWESLTEREQTGWIAGEAVYQAYCDLLEKLRRTNAS